MIGSAKSEHRFPLWAAKMVRISLVAQGALLWITIPLSLVLFLLGLVCYTDSFCEITAAGVIAFDALTAICATGLVLAGLWLRPHLTRMPITVLIVVPVAIGEVLAVSEVAIASGGSPDQFSAVAYQLTSALPLVLWPGVAAIITIAVGLLSAWGIAGGLFRIAWPGIAALISVFALTYLLPATDIRVATLHGYGLAKLPENVQGLSDSGGLPIIGLLRIDHGNEVALVPGDYVVVEGCSTPVANIRIPFHVAWGQLVVVADHCSQ